MLLSALRVLQVDGSRLEREPPSPERLQGTVFAILGDVPLCAWASVTPGNQAHINIGYFAYSLDLKLFLLSHPDSLHSRNIVNNSTMAVAVFASSQNWTDPGRGIQLFGDCRQVADADAPEAERRYGERFPEYAKWKATREPTDRSREYRLYCFTPQRIKVLDEAEFGDAVWIEADVIPP